MFSYNKNHKSSFALILNKQSGCHTLAGALNKLYPIICFAIIILITGCGGGGGGTGSGNPLLNSQSYLYMASGDLGGTISQAKLSSGTSIPLSPSNVPSAKSPSTVVASPDGHYFYVADKSSSAIYQYAISGDGILQALSPGSINLSNGTQPSSMLFDSTGHYLYVAGINTSSISVLSVGADGTLTKSGSDFTLNGQPMTLAADHRGNIYAALFNVNGNTIAHLSSGSNGALSLLSAVAIPGDSIWDTVVVDSYRNKLYAIREGAGTNTGFFVVYNIDAGGNLTQSGDPISTDSNPQNAFIDNTGNFLIMHTGDGLYSYNLNGIGSAAYINSRQLSGASPHLAIPPFKPTAPDSNIHPSVMEGTSDNTVYATCSVDTYSLSIDSHGLGSPSVTYSGTASIATAALVNR